MANTLSTKTLRDKYRLSQLDFTLRNNLVAEAICMVDRTETKTIQSPYLAAISSTMQAVAGTYTPAAFTTTDDTLTVTDEVYAATHIFDFEDVFSKFDLFAAANAEMNRSIAEKIDRFVLNNLCEDGTGAYTTPVGGFTTAANVNVIFSNIVSKVAGYAEAFDNMYVVVENTDLVGLMQAGATNGFTVSDQVIRNGKVGSWMGVDIYVVRSGTFADETLGTTTYTNSGHRVAGVKKIATYAAPRGLKFIEKEVTGKTGMEIATVGYVGFKLWAPKVTLTIDITLA